MKSLSGTLDAKLVEKLWDNREDYFKENEVDLSGISRLDSAGMAFLVLWAKATPEKKLKIHNPPKDAENLLKLFHVAPLFIF